MMFEVVEVTESERLEFTVQHDSPLFCTLNCGGGAVVYHEATKCYSQSISVTGRQDHALGFQINNLRRAGDHLLKQHIFVCN